MPWQNNGDYYSFKQDSITQHAPTVSGVYGLFNFRHQVVIASAANVRDALVYHRRHTKFRFSRFEPTGFTFEICPPERRDNRAQELIKEYGVEPLQKEWEPRVIEASRNPGKYGGDWDLAWTVLWNDEREILLKDPAERTRKERDKLTDHFLEWYSAVVSKERYTQLKFKELREKNPEGAQVHKY
jgi:hypothetical protein